MSDRQLKHRLIMIVCLTFSTAFLVTGYLFAGWWQILLIFPAVMLFWKLSKYRPGICVPSVLFGTYMFLASLGIWMGLVRYLMVYGSIMALTGWELQLFQRGWIGSTQYLNIVLLERQHLKSLSIVIILGILLTTIGLNLQLRTPFGITLLLVLLLGFVLERVYFYFVQKTP
jgi:hypothetical protein